MRDLLPDLVRPAKDVADFWTGGEYSAGTGKRLGQDRASVARL